MLGVTRIEMGVQTTDDEILRLNKRGHTIEQVKQAIHLMRQYGFKISLHLMPGLYGSNPEKDLQTFRDMFSDPAFKPDELKIYPTSVIPNTELYRLYQEGKYRPITTDEILQSIETIFREIIPPYTRIKRLIRDIPAPEIAAGSSITNLSQLAHDQLLKEYKKLSKISSSSF
jgi:elongator complex protein 3